MLENLKSKLLNRRLFSELIQNVLLLIFKSNIPRLTVTFGNSIVKIHLIPTIKFANGLAVDVPLFEASVCTKS